MQSKLCPSCSHANPVHASFCNACGLALAVRCPQCAARNDLNSNHCHACGAAIAPGHSGMVRLPLRPADAAPPPAPRARKGALPRLSMSDAVWIEAPAPADPDEPAPAASSPALNLLDLGSSTAAPAAPVDLNPQPELIQSDPEPTFTAAAEASPPTPPAALAAPAAPDSAAGDPERTPPKASAAATPKAARRAAVRRARLAADSPAAAAPARPLDVLVLDENDDLRTKLCGLLDSFGFCAHPARSHAEARTALTEREFAAVFLHIALDGTDRDSAADLCQRARQAPAHGLGSAAALIIVGSGARPVERVRASMAGADQFLVKPASRGDVARALSACGVLLPSDPRRS